MDMTSGPDDPGEWVSTYGCMRCPAAWTSHSEAEDTARRALHDQVHNAAKLLQGIHPLLTDGEALAAAAQLVGAVVNGMSGGVDVAALRAAYAFETTRG